MPPSDTSATAAAMQLELYRRAGTDGRATIALQLSEAVRATTLAGIRRRHPEYDDEEVRRAYLILVYGFDPQRHGHPRRS